MPENCFVGGRPKAGSDPRVPSPACCPSSCPYLSPSSPHRCSSPLSVRPVTSWLCATLSLWHFCHLSLCI